MTIVRTGALVASLLVVLGCGTESKVTGPSAAASPSVLGAAGGGAPVTVATVGVGSNAPADASGAPIVPISMTIPKKMAAPPVSTPMPATGAPGAIPGAAPGAVPGGVPGAVPGAPGAIPGAAPGAPAAPADPMAMLPAGAMTPTIPEVKGDCPMFVGGTITFMGLGGITVAAGPKPASPTAPFVFYWHGTGSFAGEYSGMAAAVAAGVQQEGGVLVSFQGTTGGDGLSGTAIFGKGDFDIGDQLLACAVRDHNIDPKRVYATGCSAGGLFSTAMGALRSKYMAAIAPNSGGLTFPQGFESGWTPALMTVHGAPGADVVGIDFSDSSRTADMTYKQRGGFVINCNHGGGHCGGGGLSGDIWRFFKAHPYGASPSPWKDALPGDFNSKCMIF